MEEFIIFMFDNTINPPKGDAGLKDGTEIEVKGNNAKIWGQKNGILNSTGFKIGQKSIDREFSKLLDSPYIGQFQKMSKPDEKGKRKITDHNVVEVVTFSFILFFNLKVKRRGIHCGCKFSRCYNKMPMEFWSSAKCLIFANQQ